MQAIYANKSLPVHYTTREKDVNKPGSVRTLYLLDNSIQIC